jgi:glycosyltransferase involved in cell wall biosynthesis
VLPDVALIAPYPPAGQLHGGHSGVASYTANLARALARHGVRVSVIAPMLEGDPTRFRDGTVEIERVVPAGRRALGSAMAAASATAAGVVHLQWELFLYGGASALAGLGATMLPRPVPLVTTMHQVVDPIDVDRGYTRLHRVPAPPLVARTGIRAVQRALVRASTATIVHEAQFVDILGDGRYIPHGVERPVRPDKTAARRHLGAGPGLTVLCFGFLAPYKGLELAIEAARLSGGDVQLVIAGGEHPRLAACEYGVELRRHARHVRFTGFVADDDVAKWFAAADIALLPYPKPFASSGPLALALAHGTPILLSPALARCTGAPAALQAPLDPVRLAERLRRLAADPDARAELARWTGTLAEGRGWDDVAAATARLYEEVSHGDHRAGRRLRAA